MSETYYPESPVNIPKGLTKLTSSYKLKASLAILSILLFFILYTALVLSFAYLFYYSVTYTVEYINKFTILLKIGAVAGSSMLFIFTLKFIFKLKNQKPENRIKLNKKDHPELWEFVYKICSETGAPKPKSIYVDPDVNAYVSYTNMWLSLFLPVRKELTVGLGLTCSLNLSEFKAVISHEFGHFAQRSMKIGSYIISANTIIHDMIFSRDKWDNILERWRNSDLRLSFAAWIITPVIWIIRQLLSLFYQFLNIMYSSLSREMEFNADKVAVSTSGSDAIISALWKLDKGAENWSNTISNSYLAAQKKIFVKNLYLHNILAIDRDKDEQNEKLDNLPEDLRGGKKYFSSSEHSKTSMYASHPPNDKRQDNAKSPFIECAEDSRSPWLLFAEKEELQEEMTSLFYEKYLNKKIDSFVSHKEFENFIREEKKGQDLLEEYMNTFENRFLHIPDIEVMESEGNKILPPYDNQLKTLKNDLKELMKPVLEIEALMQKAQQIAEGSVNEKSFSFQGITYKRKNLNQGFGILLTEREKLFNENFKEWDISFCSLYHAIAEKTGDQSELVDLYKQHASFINTYKAIVNVKNSVFNELNQLQTRDDVTQSEVNNFAERVNYSVLNLNKELDSLDKINFVPLSNIVNVKELKEAITENGQFKREEGNIFENGGFGRIVNNLENAAMHCQRIDQKSIGMILLFHKEIFNKAIKS